MEAIQGIAIYTNLNGYYDTLLAHYKDTTLIMRSHLNLLPSEDNYVIFLVVQLGKVYIEDFKLETCLRIYNRLIVNTYPNVINI